MKFALKKDVEKIVSPDGQFRLQRMIDNSWALIWGTEHTYGELTTLTQKEWKVIWKMLTEN